MNKKIIKETFDYITKSKFIIFIIIYLIFGSFLLANQYRYENYLVIFSRSLWRTTYMLIFVFPPLLYIILKLYNFYYSSRHFILRLESKKNIWINYIISLLLVIFYYYIVVILSMAIASNLTLHYFDLNTKILEFDVSDFTIFIIQGIKFYFILIILSLILNINIFITKNTKLYITLGYFSVILIYCAEIPFIGYLVDYRYTNIFSNYLKRFLIVYIICGVLLYLINYIISKRLVLGKE